MSDGDIADLWVTDADPLAAVGEVAGLWVTGNLPPPPDEPASGDVASLWVTGNLPGLAATGEVSELYVTSTVAGEHQPADWYTATAAGWRPVKRLAAIGGSWV